MIVDPILFLAFLPAAAVLVFTPGPDMLFAMAQGMRGGRRAAVAASAGIGVAAVVNATLAGLGLEALVSRAPWVFQIVRLVGIAYLLWLAIKTLRQPLIGENTRTVRPARAFRDGFIVNASNPSVILFILAFIPQFVDPTKAILPQFWIFGGTIALMGFVVKSIAGSTAGGLGRLLARNHRAERVLRFLTAGVFGALAARIAFAGGRP